MRALVTGATGHLGAHVVRWLIRSGHRVAAMVRPGSDTWRIADVIDEIDVVYGDLAVPESIDDVVRSFTPGVIYHLGWYGVAGAERHDFRQIQHNLIGSARLLKAARETGCAAWIGVGSQAEFGSVSRVLSEGVPPFPTTLYGAAKLSVGALALAGSGDEMRCVWFRLLATYGPYDDARRLIPSVVLHLLAGRRPALTAGEQRWDYLYVEDAAEVICLAGLLPHVKGVFVLGSGSAPTVREIVEQVRALIDPRLPLGWGEVPYPAGQPMLLQADISRLRRVLQWSPKVSLAEGVARTVNWYRDHDIHPSS